MIHIALADVFADEIKLPDVEVLSTDRDFLSLATEIALLTAEKDMAVGCVIVAEGGRHIIGASRGERCYSLDVRQRPLHAEEIAIRNAVELGIDLRGAVLYSTLEPCISRAELLHPNDSRVPVESCSSRIANAGIGRLVFGSSDNAGEDFLRSHNVDVHQLMEFAEFCDPHQLVKRARRNLFEPKP